MGLIVGDKDIRGSFEKAWTSSYVPALLQYGERSRKKSIQDIYTKLSESGTFANVQKSFPLHILITLLH